MALIPKVITSLVNDLIVLDDVTGFGGLPVKIPALASNLDLSTLALDDDLSKSFHLSNLANKGLITVSSTFDTSALQAGGGSVSPHLANAMFFLSGLNTGLPPYYPNLTLYATDGVNLFASNSNTLSKINPDTGEILGTATLTDQAGTMTFLDGRIYVNTLQGVDKVRVSDMVVEASATLAGTPSSGITNLLGFIWTANSGVLSKIDPSSMLVLSSGTDALSNSNTLTAGGGYIWAISSDNSTIYKIDPSTLTIALSIPANEGFVFDIVYAAGAIWSVSSETAKVYANNPTSGSLTKTIDLSWGNPAAGGSPVPSPFPAFTVSLSTDGSNVYVFSCTNTYAVQAINGSSHVTHVIDQNRGQLDKVDTSTMTQVSRVILGDVPPVQLATPKGVTIGDIFYLGQTEAVFKILISIAG